MNSVGGVARPPVAVRLLLWAWIALVVLLFATALWVRHGLLQQVCTTAFCDEVLTPEQAASLGRLGLSLRFYAGYKIALDIIGALIAFTVAGFVLLRRSDEWIGLFCGMVLATVPLVFIGDSISAGVPQLEGLLRYVGVIQMTYLIFFYLFPDGRFAPRITRWLAILWMLITVGDYLLEGTPLDPKTWPYWLSGVGWIGFHLSALLTQLWRYRYQADSIARQQIKWFVAGLSTVLLGVIINTVLSGAPSLAPDGAPGMVVHLIMQAVLTLCLAMVPISIGVAILRYRLWEIDLILNRLVVYAGLTGAVVGVYVLLVGGLGAAMQMAGSPLLSLLGAGLVAVLFHPVREWLQGAANRLMYGERDAPYTVIARLGKRLEASLAPGAVPAAVVETVAQALRLPYAAIWFRGDTRPRAEWGASVSDTVAIPLVSQQEEVGRLLLAPRSPGELFSEPDLRLLGDLARQAGIAAHAVQLTEALQRSRAQLVTTREEERRRLRRDLHDGLGPTLASLSMKLDVALARLDADPHQTRLLLTQSRAQAEGVLTDIRQLVYGLRPPALDEFGLLYAVREQAAQYAGTGVDVVVEGPDPMPPLPAAVEVAAYRIAQEALNNAVRHSGCRRCRVSFVCADALRVEIADDGRGLPPARRLGLGLRTMQERAAELGGRCEIEPAPQGGTRVRADLPLPKEEPGWNESVS